MSTETIITELRDERDRITLALNALEGKTTITVPGAGVTFDTARPKRKYTRRMPVSRRIVSISSRRPIGNHTKPHWTQTPEGKRKMAKIQRKAWLARSAGA